MKRSPRSTRVIGYLRVSTEEQALSGLGLAAQRAAIEAEAIRRNWSELSYLEDEGKSARTLQRAALTDALCQLGNGHAGTLVVAKLDRLSRSLLDFATLMERARREAWELVVLDMAIDTSSPSGALMANVLASFSEYERMVISQRTALALQAKKSQGARLGRPVQMSRPTRDRIALLHEQGLSLSAIAALLNEEGIPTARGGSRWYPSTIAACLRSRSLDLADARPVTPAISHA